MKTFAFGLALITALVAGVSSTPAAMVTQTLDYGSASAPVYSGNTATLSFNKFNPSLGTLTDIILTLTSVDTIQSTVFNFGSTPEAYTGSYVTGGNETVSALSGAVSTAISGVTTPVYSGTTSAGMYSVTVAGSVTAPPIAQSTTILSGLAQYIGTSGNVALPVSVALSSSSATSHVTGNLVGSGWNADSYGTLAVEYDFIPIPETGTWLIGLGALGLTSLSILRRNHPAQV
jgi:hypothetical protein